MISDSRVCASITEVHFAMFIYIIDGDVCIGEGVCGLNSTSLGVYLKLSVFACGADWAE